MGDKLDIIVEYNLESVENISNSVVGQVSDDHYFLTLVGCHYRLKIHW